MVWRFGESSFEDHILYCKPQKRSKFTSPYSKEFCGIFTDSLIVVCAERYNMELNVVRESLRDMISRKKKAIKEAKKTDCAHAVTDDNFLPSIRDDELPGKSQSTRRAKTLTVER